MAVKSAGDGRRVARMEKEVQQAVASFLISGFRSEFGALITVTSVRMPADLRMARVYVSILLPDLLEAAEVNNSKLAKSNRAKKMEMIIDELQDAAPDFQHYLAAQMKARYCPKLEFFQDESTEHVIKVERILRDLHEQDGFGTRSNIDSGAATDDSETDE